MADSTAPSITDTGTTAAPEVVLASASRSRLELLRHAGVQLRAEPARLVQERRNRLGMIAQGKEDTDYVEPVCVREEIAFARKL